MRLSINHQKSQNQQFPRLVTSVLPPLCSFVSSVVKSCVASLKTKRSLFADPQKRNTIVCLLLAVVTLALYNPVNRHPFVNYDDDRYVTKNPHVRQGLTADTFTWALTSTEQANWHPLTWMSHALDCLAVSAESRRAPFHQHPAACGQCDSAFSAFDVGNQSIRAEFVRGRVVRASSHQRGVGCVGGRAQERSVHAVFLPDALGVWLVCAKAGLEAVSGGRCSVRGGAGVEADGDHAAVCTAAARLLAAGAGPRSTRRGRQNCNAAVVAACDREVAAARTLRCQRRHDDAGATGRRRDSHNFRSFIWSRASRPRFGPTRCICGR